ncbi:alkane 1-monooxygenase [Aquimarina brevivitae]|uniref:Alkane 1-monooxygenase n=1 Tax=Aquimarina brevivitae TaxID=323412 RepID=A0A4Q7PFS2_9FLAO|nr:alkane 1-monooxygenase [Aquimarina brevivitae]RZS99331.1 alkane 1-monooxygenase [Aquimarina brevivitae]
MKSVKYLLAYTVPLTAAIAIYLQNLYTYLTPIYVFVLLPILEQLLPQSKLNPTKEEALAKKKDKLYDWLLYLNLPLTHGILIYALYLTHTTTLDNYELIGIIFSTGIVLGTNGINVGHELGHRPTPERFIGKLLLLPSLYMHFFIEHNHGHHIHVATEKDPATAKLNQPIYIFWLKSIPYQYINAWKIQLQLLQSKHKSFWSIYNDMLCFLVITIFYLSAIYLLFDTKGLLVALFSGMIGFLLLETINYIEHYGLLRNKKASGRFERVAEIHSWNSNHTLGRIVLYELTRHSDHHFKAHKKYQILAHHEQSPQLPYGYPGSMLLSLIPPLWFKIMNKRVPKHMVPATYA